MKNIKLIIVLGVALFLSACETPINIGCISPEGEVETRVVDFASFDKIEITGDAQVFITEGSTQEVVIEAATNIIDRLLEDSSVRGGELNIEINGCSKIDDGELIVRVTMSSLTGLQITGDGLFETVGVFENVEDLVIDITGDGDINLQLADINFLSAEIEGDGEVDCSGTADVVELEIDGDGDFNLFDLVANELIIDITGDGNCELNIVQRLEIDITGDGDVEAIGTADRQEIEITGDGNIRNFGLIAAVTDIDLTGDGDCEVNVTDELIVKMTGGGSVCYRGNPDIDLDTPTTGTLTNCN